MGGVEEIPGSSRDNTRVLCDVEVVYFAPLRLFRHSDIQRPRLVGKCSRRCVPGVVPESPKEAPPADSRGKLRGINSATRAKTGGSVRVCAASALAPFFTARRLFGCFLDEARDALVEARPRRYITRNWFPPPLAVQSVNFSGRVSFSSLCRSTMRAFATLAFD